MTYFKAGAGEKFFKFFSDFFWLIELFFIYQDNIENYSMDSIDKKILMLIQEDVTLPLAELAARVNLSQTPCWKRIKRLESEGVIRRRVALLDPEKVGLGVSVFVHLKTTRHDSHWLSSFSKQIERFPEVAEAYRMSGEWDYLLRIVVKDIAAFDQFYKKLVNSVEGLSDVTSSFAMQETALYNGFTFELTIIRDDYVCGNFQGKNRYIG